MKITHLHAQRVRIPQKAPIAPYQNRYKAGTYNTDNALLVEFDGADPDAVDLTLAAAAEACEKEGARDLLVAQTDVERNRLWAARRQLYP